MGVAASPTTSATTVVPTEVTVTAAPAGAPPAPNTIVPATANAVVTALTLMGVSLIPLEPEV
jgi:hypothetical protein